MLMYLLHIPLCDAAEINNYPAMKQLLIAFLYALFEYNYLKNYPITINNDNKIILGSIAYICHLLVVSIASSKYQLTLSKFNVNPRLISYCRPPTDYKSISFHSPI